MARGIYRYEIYGVHLASDFPLPECSARPIRRGGRLPAVLLRMGRRFPRAPGTRWRRVNGFKYRFNPGGRSAWARPDGAGEFHVRFQDRVIEWTPAPSRKVRGIDRFVVRSKILGFLLTHQPSSLVLHGNVVVQGEAAVVLCAGWGRGKSTLTGSLLTEGFELLSDDMAVIREKQGGFFVEPGIPEVRLWPEGARLLGASCRKIPARPLYTGIQKRRFLLTRSTPWRFHGRRAPLRMVCFLERTDRKRGRVRSERMDSSAALLSLLKNVYSPAVEDPRILRGMFQTAGRLARAIPAIRLFYPSGAAHLAAVRESILRSLGSA